MSEQPEFDVSNWSPLASFVSGASGFFNNLWSYFLSENQNSYNTEMWSKSLAWNSPAAQVQRLKEAGLNPALMYGTISTGNTNSSPSASAVQHSPIDLSNIVALAMQSEQMDQAQLNADRDYALRLRSVEASIANQEKNWELIDSRIIDGMHKRALWDTQNAKTEFELAQAERMKDLVYDIKKMQLESIKSGISNQKSMIEARTYQNLHTFAKYLTELKKPRLLDAKSEEIEFSNRSGIGRFDSQQTRTAKGLINMLQQIFGEVKSGFNY